MNIQGLNSYKNMELTLNSRQTRSLCSWDCCSGKSRRIEDGFYDQWYENALVQLIFKNNFKLYYTDIASYDWTEVDSVNDLLHARQIHAKEKYVSFGAAA